MQTLRFLFPGLKFVAANPFRPVSAIAIVRQFAAVVAMTTMVLLASALPATAQTALVSNWTQLSPATSPPGIGGGVAMAYDASHGRVVLLDNSGNTWTWDGSTWTEAATSGPGAREYTSMAYDASTGTVVLFGGLKIGTPTAPVSDTWTWNGTSWTQQTPAHNPPAREAGSMAYDASHGVVVLTGGTTTFSGSGAIDDTWTWSGADWTNAGSGPPTPSPCGPGRWAAAMDYDPNTQTVLLFGGECIGSLDEKLGDQWEWNGTSWGAGSGSTTPFPPARFDASMAYDPAIGAMVLFGGSNSGNLDDTWTYANSQWTQETPVTNPGGRYLIATAYDANHGTLVLFGGNTGSAFPADTWTYSPASSANLGTANVCPAAATTPAPCSQTATLTFTFTSADVGIAPSVVTQGATGLDFTDLGTGSCNIVLSPGHGYSPGQTCTVDLMFAPTKPGLRSGAVVLKDAAGIAATVYVYGTGTGPQIAWGPPAQTTLSGSFSSPGGVAVDSAGTVYVTDANPYVSTVPAGTLGGGLSNTTAGSEGVAIDGAGNLYVADGNNSSVFEIPAGCTNASCTVALGGGFNFPVSVAVDGSGSVYIADSTNSTVPAAVKEMPPGCTATAYTAGMCQITTLGTGFGTPQGVAVDATGDVFVADNGNGTVTMMTPNCTSSACMQTLGSGAFSNPYGVALDAEGNLWVTDWGPGAVLKMPPNCTSPTCVVTTVSTGFSEPEGVVVDGAGDVYVADTGHSRVVELNVSTPPAFTFPTTTAIGVEDSDPPMGPTVENIGNAPLVLSVPSSGFNPSVPAGFLWDAKSTCTQVSSSVGLYTIPAGGSCAALYDFEPTTSGTNSGSAVFMDNNLNAVGATQSVMLSGTGAAATPSITALPTASAITFGQALTSSMLSPGTAMVGSTTVPGGYTFTSPATVPSSAGVASVGFTFTPSDTTDYNTVTGSVNVVVNKAPTMVTVSPVASAITSGQTLASSTLTGGTVVSTITGATLGGTYTFTNPSTAPTATALQSVTFTPGDSNDYLGTTTSVPVTVNPPPASLSISPASINFGAVYQGSIITRTVTITNSGSTTVTIGNPLIAIVPGGNSKEFVTVDLCPKSLAAGKSCTMTVTFLAGSYYTPQTANLMISDSAPGSPQSVPLTATVIDPVPQFSPSSGNFGVVKVGSSVTKAITLTSVGGTALNISTVGVTGASAGEFTQSNTCAGQSLNPKGTCTITVTLKATSKGAISATLMVNDNALGGSQSIKLTAGGD